MAERGERSPAALAQPLPETTATIRVLLAIVGFPILAAGYRAALEAAPGLAVVGEVAERERLADGVAGADADVVVTECLPWTAGSCTSLATIEEIRAARPDVRILAIECRCGREQFAPAIRAGANGFLARESEPSEVVAAIRAVGRGETYASPAVVSGMVDTYVLRRSPQPAEAAVAALDQRAREVFRLAALGHTNREIARALHVPERTVHSSRASIMEKLGVHDRTDLLRQALRHGLVEADEL